MDDPSGLKECQKQESPCKGKGQRKGHEVDDVYTRFARALKDLVDSDDPWRDKRDRLKTEGIDTEIEEFCAWFEPTPEQESS